MKTIRKLEGSKILFSESANQKPELYNTVDNRMYDEHMAHMEPKYVFETGSKSSAHLSAQHWSINQGNQGGRSGKIIMHKKHKPIIHTANRGQSCQRRLYEGFYP